MFEGTIPDIWDNLGHLGHLGHRMTGSTFLKQGFPGKTGLFEQSVESLRRQTSVKYSQHRLPTFFVFCCFFRKSLVHIQREAKNLPHFLATVNEAQLATESKNTMGE